LLDDTSIQGARGILINFTGGSDLSIHEVEEAARIVQEAAHEDANIIFGAVIDPNMGDEVRMTVIATGFSEKKETQGSNGKVLDLPRVPRSSRPWGSGGRGRRRGGGELAAARGRDARRGRRRARRRRFGGPCVPPPPGRLGRVAPARALASVVDGGAPEPSLLPHGQPPAYFTFAALSRLGVPHATTTRHCPGVLSFAEPISPANPSPPFRADAVTALARAGLDLARVAYAKQVHGAAVARVTGGGFAGVADGLVTTARGVPLAIFTADCLAIVLYDPAGAGARRGPRRLARHGAGRRPGGRRRARGPRRPRQAPPRGDRAVDRALLLRGR